MQIWGATIQPIAAWKTTLCLSIEHLMGTGCSLWAIVTPAAVDRHIVF